MVPKHSLPRTVSLKLILVSLILLAVKIDAVATTRPRRLNTEQPAVARCNATVAQNISKDDLMITFALETKTLGLVEASRLWRDGIPTHVVIDTNSDLHALEAQGTAHNETFTVLPDFPGHPSTHRQVLAPLFAYKATAHHNFKWLLVGDADTVFVIPAVLRLLNKMQLNPDDPHMLSDYLTELKPCNPEMCFGIHKFTTVDRRCSTCPEGMRWCPCKLKDGCKSSEQRLRSTSKCPIKYHVVAYGGVGVIYSIGMLRKLTEDAKFYVPHTFLNLRGKQQYGDAAYAEMARSINHGYTKVPSLKETLQRMNATSDAKRRFGTHSAFEEMRSVSKQLSDLRELKEKKDPSLLFTLSHHVRAGKERMQFEDKYLPAYREIASLLMSLHHEPPVVGCEFANDTQSQAPRSKLL